MNKQTIKSVKVSATGVQFGSCWLSHEKITGYTADQLNSGECDVIGGQYVAWLSTEEPGQVFDEAKERKLFESHIKVTRPNSKLRVCGSDFSVSIGQYYDLDVEHLWVGWLACAKSRAGIQP